ncbi:hypothetical protein J6590_093928 [Homalodisca vitripennis]|nr:hypothetical protein J6590_093928 [Homalodisca vitripennis]
MKFFDLNNVPKTVSWIKKLTIEEAREQCKLWGVKPKDKLDAMRVQLSEFVARSSEGVVSDLEESADEPRVPVTDDLVDNTTLKQDEVGTCTLNFLNLLRGNKLSLPPTDGSRHFLL